MAISFGPKLGLLYNALINEQYYDSLRLFLQSLDALVQGSVINSSNVVPPVSPNPGDAYLLTTGTPSGAWTGQGGNIAVWDAQLTLTGTNNVVPGWIFLIPQAGWIIWNVALGGLYVFNGTSWTAVGGSGANFPTNTDITSMTGIPNTTIGTTGYNYNDGTNPPTDIGAVTTGGAGPNGFQWGTGNFATPTSAGTVIIGDGPWTGLAASGVGVGVASSVDSCVMTYAGIQTSGVIEGNLLQSNGNITAQGNVQIGAGTTGTYGAIIPRGPSNVGISISAIGVTTLVSAVVINSGTGSPTSGIGLLGFGPTYYTQTTVGAAGSASALPSAPKGYLQFVAPDSSICVLPYYAHV
jgi:hypothetical protein